MPPWQIIESLEVEALHINILLTRIFFLTEFKKWKLNSFINKFYIFFFTKAHNKITTKKTKNIIQNINKN